MSSYIPGLVSVIIPTYRRAEKLNRAIKSVLNQTYSKIELLVVNDNEPGDSYSIKLENLINSIDDERISLVKQEKHINGAAARNAGISKAKGEYIAFLDDDDYWEPDKLEKQLRVLINLDPSWGGVSCRKKYYNKNKFIRATLPYKDGNIYEEILLRRAEVSTVTLLLRRDALDETGYFDESLNRHQELQLLTFFTYKYKLKLVNEFLCNIDISDNQNRPDFEKLKQVKLDFFESVEPIMSKLSKRKQKRIYLMHNFELGYVMLKNKQYLNGIITCLSVLKSPITLYFAMERTLKRTVESKFKNYLSNKK